MLRTEMEKYQGLIFRTFIVIVVIIITLLVLTAFKFVFAYFMPFILAFILSLVLEPLVKFFQGLKIRRGLAVFMSIILFLGTFITFSVFAITRITYEFSKLYRSLPDYYTMLYDSVTQIIQSATDLYLQLPPEATDITQDVLKTLFQKLTGILSQTATSVVDTVTALPGALIFFIITMIATFFLTKDKYIIKDFIFRQLPGPWGSKLVALKNDLFIALVGFAKAQSIILTATFTESYVGLSIMGIEYAFIIAVCVALVDILPVLGTGSIYVPWAIANFAWGNYKLGISLLVLYGIITMVRYMIEPKIVGSQLGIHPIVALMSMFAGLKIIGVAGLILGPTVVVFIKACQHAGILPKFK